MPKLVSELKVLVVESNKPTIESICDHIGLLGILHPFIAQTGQAAVEIFRKERPDMVLLEATLPDIDGFNVAKKIRALEQAGDWSAIIFLTSMSKDEHLERGIEVGADDYMLKPIRGVVLKAKIRAIHRLLEMQRTWVEASRQLEIANKELQRLAATDKVTGVANRNAFDEVIDREWRRCMRMKRPVTLVLVEIDHFKEYSEAYGQQAGDDCLRAISAQIARSAPRASDHLARYGEDEFALVLGETDGIGTRHVINNVRQHIAELRLPHSASVTPFVTVSCGISSVVPHADLSLENFLKSANIALTKAKERGHNTVIFVEFGQIA